jgi:peptidoglycan/xylan/chitin deacetylase (PgdA/CDA1 family)
MSTKDLIYSLAKATGLFAQTRRWTRDGLNILCYHGFSFTDEHLFRPKLFQTPELFRQRMAYLRSAGFETLTLDEAVRRMRGGVLGEKEIVITIDDGFYSVASLAAPILREFGFVATIYVTTYYVQRNNPIFRLAMQYIFWKTRQDSLECNDLMPVMGSMCPVKGVEGDKALWTLIEFGENQLDEEGRLNLAREVAKRLEVDFDELVTSRRLTLMTEAEIADLASRGFDIQLHTHRHRLPAEHDDAKRELDDNKAVLSSLTTRPLTHLCYPSGVWSTDVWPLLASEGIETATTCEPGINYPTTPLLGMRRFLDFQTTPQIVFEAEVNGFSEILRRMVGRS